MDDDREQLGIARNCAIPEPFGLRRVAAHPPGYLACVGQWCMCAGVGRSLRNRERRSIGGLPSGALAAEWHSRRAIGSPEVGAVPGRTIDEPGAITLRRTFRSSLARHGLVHAVESRVALRFTRATQSTSYSAANPIRLLSKSTTGPEESTCSSSNVRHSQPMARSTWLAAFCALLLKLW